MVLWERGREDDQGRAAVLPCHNYRERKWKSRLQGGAPADGQRAVSLAGNGHLSQWILISFSTSLNSGSPVTSSEFFTFASAAAKQSA